MNAEFRWCCFRLSFSWALKASKVKRFHNLSREEPVSVPDHPHGEMQTHDVKAEDHSHPDRKPVRDGGVSDPCRSQAEQTHACAGLHVWAGCQARGARTLWLQGEPSQPSETEKLQPTPPAIMPPGRPCFIWKCTWKFPCEHPFYLTATIMYRVVFLQGNLETKQHGLTLLWVRSAYGPHMHMDSLKVCLVLHSSGFPESKEIQDGYL